MDDMCRNASDETLCGAWIHDFDKWVDDYDDLDDAQDLIDDVTPSACRAIPADMDQVIWLEGERLRLLSRANALWGSLSTAWGQIDQAIKLINADLKDNGETTAVLEDLLDLFNQERREKEPKWD